MSNISSTPMTTTRRDFLRMAGGAAAGIPLIPLLGENAAALTQESAGRRNGLLFDASDLPRMRKALTHPHVAPYWASIVNADLAADTKFLRDEARLNNHAKDMLRVRQILERTAFVYAVTASAAHADVARRAVDKILAYPKWDYFLEGGEHVIGLQRAPEATIAMACAREWLETILSRETVGEMERQIAEKGAPACYRTLYGMKYPDRVRGWGFDPEDDYAFRFDLSRWPFILNSTNLKVIPIAGLGLAGCLLHGRHPQADRWIDLAVQSAQAFSGMFGPDGSYDEGVGYWGYTALHLTILVEAVRRTLGKDLSGIINYPGTVRYGLRMAMATEGRPADCVNFSDAWSMGDVSVAAWTARQFKDPIAQYVATQIGQLGSHFSVIWLDPDAQSKEPGADLLDVRFSNDWVVGRSGWKLADGVVALRSGGPANHEHADRNSVVFKAYGERIYHDPYKAAYSYTEPHWLLRKTEAHTAVLIDGKGHQYHDGHEGTNASWAEARVVAYRSSDSAMVVTSDATDAYRLVNADVGSVQRTLVFLKPDLLVLFDRVILKSNSVPVQVRFQIDNSDGKGSVKADGTSFVVLRPQAASETSVFGSGSVAVHTGTLNVPAEHGVHPYAEVVSAPSRDHAILTVCAARRPGDPPAAIRTSRVRNGFHIEGSIRGSRIAVTIDIDGEIPKVTIG
jgi:hypothetical protein